MCCRPGPGIAGLGPVGGLSEMCGRSGSTSPEGVKQMAKSTKREYVWLQCTESGDLNYRVSVNVSGGHPQSSS